MNSKTYMWREVEGKPAFLFQTNEKNVHAYMSRSEGFKLVAWGVNVHLWVFRAEFPSVLDAEQALKAATMWNKSYPINKDKPD